MVWPDGKLLHGGKYQIERILGRGGFGITYKARHTQLNQDFVIKTPDETLKIEPDYPKYVKRFIQEGQVLAQLCKEPHLHIVRVIDLFSEGDTHCLVMDFIEGESLYERVQRRGRLPEAEAVKYIREIGSALIEVHKANLVHRDVHPGNIMLRSSGKAVLIDFGISGEMFPKTMTSKHFGNKAFAPYEQQRKGSRHPTVDIYTLAASLYYALTGQLPTDSFDRKYDGIELKAPKQLVPSISDGLNQAILRGMALEAQDRPQSVQAWLQLLDISKQESKTLSLSNKKSSFWRDLSSFWRELFSQEGQRQILTPKETEYQKQETEYQKQETEYQKQETEYQKQETDDLSSERGVDYTKLRDLLAQGKWKEADKETLLVMLKVAGREAEGYLRVEDIEKFPCTDFRTIDTLWVKYSKGSFGFSVQKRIWESVGGTPFVDYETYCRFCDRIKWRVNNDWLDYEQLTFSLEKAPEGHLPFCEDVFWYDWVFWLWGLFSRAETCKL
jgi:serine/threonine-protein kinase